MTTPANRFRLQPLAGELTASIVKANPRFKYYNRLQLRPIKRSVRRFVITVDWREKMLAG